MDNNSESKLIQTSEKAVSCEGGVTQGTKTTEYITNDPSAMDLNQDTQNTDQSPDNSANNQKGLDGNLLQQVYGQSSTFLKKRTGDSNENVQVKRRKLNSTISVDTSGTYKELEKPDLTGMKHIVFLDFDNVGNFFDMIEHNLPDKTFIWIFRGGRNTRKTPDNDVYKDAVERGLVYFQSRNGTSKNAADSGITLMIGDVNRDKDVPKSVPFTIISDDHGFREVERLFEGNERRVTVFEPYGRKKDEFEAMLKSVTDC